MSGVNEKVEWYNVGFAHCFSSGAGNGHFGASI